MFDVRLRLLLAVNPLQFKERSLSPPSVSVGGMEEKYSKFPPGTRGNDRLGNTRERQIGLSPPSVFLGGMEENFSKFPPGTRGNDR